VVTLEKVTGDVEQLLAEADAAVDEVSVLKMPWDRRLMWRSQAGEGGVRVEVVWPSRLIRIRRSEASPQQGPDHSALFHDEFVLTGISDTTGYQEYLCREKKMIYNPCGRWEIRHIVTDVVGETTAGLTNVWLPLVEFGLKVRPPAKAAVEVVWVDGRRELLTAVNEAAVNKRPVFVGLGLVLSFEEAEMAWLVKRGAAVVGLMRHAGLVPWEGSSCVREILIAGELSSAGKKEVRIRLVPQSRLVVAKGATTLEGLLGMYEWNGDMNDRPIYFNSDSGMVLWYTGDVRRWVVTEAVRLGEGDVCAARSEVSYDWSPLGVKWEVADGLGGFREDDNFVFLAC
jgi:hypothetical protein